MAGQPPRWGRRGGHGVALDPPEPGSQPGRCSTRSLAAKGRLARMREPEGESYRGSWGGVKGAQEGRGCTQHREGPVTTCGPTGPEGRVHARARKGNYGASKRGPG